ncbi:MAG TPA: hypothetical protein VH413_09295 [Verrucomicrobiae bacterium]|nr:hypothetical protein [Verrucomicrobiae bacterium]
MKANPFKFSLTLSILVLLCALSGYAQDGTTPSPAPPSASAPPPPPAPGDHSPEARAARNAALQKMLANFTLTPLQRAQINDALKNQGRRIVMLRNDPSVTQANQLDKIREILDDTDATLKGIFSPEQFTMWMKATRDMRPPGTAPASTNSSSADAAAPKAAQPKPADPGQK